MRWQILLHLFAAGYFNTKKFSLGMNGR